MKDRCRAHNSRCVQDSPPRGGAQRLTRVAKIETALLPSDRNETARAEQRDSQLNACESKLNDRLKQPTHENGHGESREPRALTEAKISPAPVVQGGGGGGGKEKFLE